jgi:hypothetical protein
MNVPTSVRATVAICTRNRAETLARVLESFCAQTVPEGTAWELLVIDNGSTDPTRDVADAFASRLPLRVVDEPEPGLSAARNRAVLAARGEFMLWIDDDAIPSPGWIAAYLAAFSEWPAAAVFGGPIGLEFDAPLPGWFVPVLPVIGGVYGQRDLGRDAHALRPCVTKLPFGTNYATRTSDQRRFPYDTRLGRHPSHPTRGAEETEVLLSMLESGLEGRWVPAAAVTHLKGIAQARTRYIVQQISEYGAYQAVRYPPPGVRVFGAPVSLWWKCARAWSRYGVGRLLRPPQWWMPQLVEASESSGAIRGLRRRR